MNQVIPCAECHRVTVQLQRCSLRSTTRWLQQFALFDFTSDAAPLPEDFVLLRCVPACDELACEAPVRRDGSVRLDVMRQIRAVFNAGWEWWPELQAQFITSAIRWAKEHAHVAEHSAFTFGPAS